MKNIFALALLIGLFSCSSMKVAYDYDRQVDFTKYKTYTFSKEALELPVGDINRDRMLKAIDEQLALKGFTKSESADVIIDLTVKAQKQTTATATTTGTGYGYPYRYGYGGGFSTTTVDYDTYIDGTLIVNIVDNATQKIVWQGTVTKTIDENASAEKREKNINYGMQQMFMNYPPVKK